jgi:small subunit ribosomal protein S7
MPRKKREFKKIILPDPKYRSLLITKTVSAICQHGKKGVAEKALYSALEIVATKLSSDPIEVFKKAIENVRPLVEVRSRRVGGANYQIPTEVKAGRSEALAIRWMVEASNQRSEKKLELRLAGEIIDATQGRGGAMKIREDTHRMAEANKAFAHFKW